MISLFAYVFRGKLIESKHHAVCLVKNIYYKNILSTNSDKDLIYPRSAIKIFQALPFINSNAYNLFKLNEKIIAISCSSHAGESQHINVLKNWLTKTNIKLSQLKCGIHNPLNEKSSNNLLLSNKTPSQIHNNCSGKHLGMISGCMANKMNIKNYINLDHPYQKLIRNVLESFMELKIKKKSIGIDGCGAPQYAFPLANISTSMINLIKEKKSKSMYSDSINKALSSINKFPILIGGHDRFDSDVIKITKGRIFCKGGAEGVLLFADFNKKVGGAIKITDGNNRAIPSITIQVFIKLKLLTKNEIKKLDHWRVQKIFNHRKKEVGKIVANLL